MPVKNFSVSQHLQGKMISAFFLHRSLAILQMPQIELSHWLLSEIEKNPILELDQIDLPSFSYELSCIPANASLYDHITSQIRERFLSSEERTIAMQIASCLDERGYLVESLEEMAQRLGLSLIYLSSFLPILQDLDPPGIFARCLQECLLLQLKSNPASPAYQIVQTSFEDLLRGRFEAIKKRLRLCDLAPVISCLARLSFHPADAFKPVPFAPAFADLSIERQSNRWVVGTRDEWLPKFHVRTDYCRLTCETSEEKELLRSWISSAKGLCRSLEKRKAILLQIGLLLIKKQSAFLNHEGPLALLTLQDLAQELQLHHSTISRALSGKYAMTPRGLLPLKSLLTPSPQTESAKYVLQQLVVQEDKNKPMTDQELMLQLKCAGFSVARRTVSKYRSQLKIRSTALRKNLR